MAAKIKDIHIHKLDDLNSITIHFEFTNGWNEAGTLKLDDDSLSIAMHLRALADQIEGAEQLDT